MFDNMTAAQYEAFVRSLPGSIIEGWHKGPNGRGHTMSLEATAVAAIPTRYGEKTYVVGTRLDGDNAGKLQTVRLDAFNLKTLVVKAAKGFKPADLTGWYVRPQGADVEALAHFAWMEYLTEPEDIALAVSMGVNPLTQYVLADKVVAKKTRKANKPAEAPVEA